MSNQWKTLTLSFQIMQTNFSWRVSYGKWVRVGTNTIMGCGNKVFLSNNMIYYLHNIGKHTLNFVVNPMTTNT